jgi:uncharacterized protein YlxP (DUF503 family)
MTIGVLQLELRIGDAMSLKDKRRVIKSLKDRIAHGHNVSIAEVGPWTSIADRSSAWPWSPTTPDTFKAPWTN